MKNAKKESGRSELESSEVADHDADYEAVLLSQKKAKRVLDKAADFVAEVTTALGGSV